MNDFTDYYHKQKCNNAIKEVFNNINTKLYNATVIISRNDQDLEIDLEKEILALQEIVKYHNNKRQDDKLKREEQEKKLQEEHQKQLAKEVNEFKTKIQIFDFHNAKKNKKSYFEPKIEFKYSSK